MISQLFILAPNGHTIVHKDYRGEVPKEASETFLRQIVEKSESSPIFELDGVNYLCVRKNGLFFMCTTVYNVSPAFVIEMLTQLTKVCKEGLRMFPPEREVIRRAIFQRKGVHRRLMAVVPRSRRYHCLSITSRFFARLSSMKPNSPTCARLKATKVDSWVV